MIPDDIRRKIERDGFITRVDNVDAIDDWPSVGFDDRLPVEAPKALTPLQKYRRFVLRERLTRQGITLR